MAGFSKLFSTMWGGSLYGRFEASAVFMVLLSLCDHNGVVDMTPEAIAGTTGWPIDFIKKGLGELEAPDVRSRTKDSEGRRIVLIDGHRNWGWSLTNYAKYRDHMRSVERTEYMRLAKQKERERKNNSQPLSTSDNHVQPITEAEAEADTLTTLSSKQLDASPLFEKKQKNSLQRNEAIEVLTFLNEKTGRNYRSVDSNLKPIIARLRSGATVQDCRTMIARKFRDWHNDEKMEKYLRPLTLFRPSNFENYLGECVENG